MPAMNPGLRQGRLVSGCPIVTVLDIIPVYLVNLYTLMQEIVFLTIIM
ncbi:MAG: hypothetical protein K8T10_09025 [Candidatus Eremiobacteraeota bacterium]|nr:hypothetical protein [Candidatus Eremiobacteraeota bacterium]